MFIGMKLKLSKIIELYDTENSDGCHVSAITGIIGEELVLEAFKHWLKSQNKTVREVKGTPREKGEKGSKGKRLDAWLCVGNRLHQIEIKNWSAYSLGGKPVPKEPDKLKEYRIRKWSSRWDDDKKAFKRGRDYEGLEKVLREMKKPIEHQSKDVIPTLCFWFPIHEKGKANPSFEVNLSDRYCSRFPQKKLKIFSASNYLRFLVERNKNRTLTLKLPKAERRLKIINEIQCKR